VWSHFPHLARKQMEEQAGRFLTRLAGFVPASNSRVDSSPFGGLAIPEGPMALRPAFAGGLLLSRNPAAKENSLSHGFTANMG